MKDEIKAKAYEKISEVLDELHPEQRGVYMHGFFDALAFFEKVLEDEENSSNRSKDIKR